MKYTEQELKDASVYLAVYRKLIYTAERGPDRQYISGGEFERRFPKEYEMVNSMQWVQHIFKETTEADYHGLFIDFAPSQNPELYQRLMAEYEEEQLR